MNRSNRTLPTLLLAALLAAVVPLAGCGGGVKEDPILRLSAAESLTQGKELLAREKYRAARPYLSHAFEVEPNSVAGREGLLLLADSFYLDGGVTNWIQAEAKYRDFLNRFPTSDQAAYAQYQIANSLSKRVEKPNRDQTATRKALAAFDELLRLYPTSEYTAEAQAQIDALRERLAASEFVVGDFYLRYRQPAGAILRFENLLEEFPEYERDKVLYHLGLAYARSPVPADQAKASEVFERLRSEHPESRWVAEIPRDLPRPADGAEEAAPRDEPPPEVLAGEPSRSGGGVSQR